MKHHEGKWQELFQRQTPCSTQKVAVGTSRPKQTEEGARRRIASHRITAVVVIKAYVNHDTEIVHLLSAGAEIEWFMPAPLPLRPPPSGGSVCAETPPDAEEEVPPLVLFRQKVVPGPDPNPLAAWSSILETDLSILLSSLRTRLVLEHASPINCEGGEG